MSHLERQLSRLRAAMHAAGVPAVHLVRPEHLAWLTGARSYVAQTGERGVLEAVVTAQGCTFISNAIERGRLMEEEGVPDIRAHDWWDAAGREALLREAAQGHALTTDVPALPAALEALRLSFDPAQDAELRALGEATGRAISRAARSLRPELSEFEACARLALEAGALGLSAVVNLCAGQARMRTRRHPLPTAAPLGGMALLVVCTRRDGPVLSASRIVSFGLTAPDLQRRYADLLDIEADLLDTAERGGTLEDVFLAAQDGYARTGQPGEIRAHHQGGLAGYRPREARAEPGQTLHVQDGHLVALNPSVPGLKVEDTFLRRGGELHNLTLHDWPVQAVRGRDRPEILELPSN